MRTCTCASLNMKEVVAMVAATFSAVLTARRFKKSSSAVLLRRLDGVSLARYAMIMQGKRERKAVRLNHKASES